MKCQIKKNNTKSRKLFTRGLGVVTIQSRALRTSNNSRESSLETIMGFDEMFSYLHRFLFDFCRCKPPAGLSNLPAKALVADITRALCKSGLRGWSGAHSQSSRDSRNCLLSWGSMKLWYFIDCANMVRSGEKGASR